MHTCKRFKLMIGGKMHFIAVKKPLPFPEKSKILQIA
jgi:hypothetical protein